MMQSWGNRIRANAGYVALLLVLPAFAYVPALFQGTLPFAPGGILALPPWEAAADPGGAPEDPLSTWQLSTAWPAYQFISAHGHDPGQLFWNPDVGLGQPFLANLHNRVFSPFTVPFYLVGPDTAWLLSLWLKLAVAGWTAFYCARRYGFAPGFALVAALIFQWSGPVFRWGAEPMGDILPWFPLLLLATDRLLIGQFTAWPRFAAALALMVLGGDLRLVAMLVGLLLAYILLRRARHRHHVRLAVAFAGGALGILAGFGLAAPQLLPYWTLLREGSTAPGGYPWDLPAGTLLALFGPGYHETVTGASHPLVPLVHIGAVPLLAIGLWLAIRRQVEKPMRHRVECLGLAALAAAAVPFVAGGYLDRIPLLSYFHPAHYLAGLALPLALMVAGAAETWLHLDARECKRVLVRMALILPLYWGGIAFAGYLFARGAAEQPWAPLIVHATALAVLAVLFAVTLLIPNARVMTAGLAVTILAATGASQLPHTPHADRALIFPETEVIQSLQAAGARLGGTAGLADWPLSGNGIPALHARGTVALNRTTRFLDDVARDPLLQRRAGVGALLLQREDIQGPYAAVRPDLNILEVFDSGAVLFRDLSTQPPYRIAHAAQPASTPETRPRHADSMPVVEGFAMPRREGPFEVEIALNGDPSHTEIPLSVSSNEPGLLIVTAAWYPRWEARVDGKPARVHPVDGAFQGVEVMAGDHEVRLLYVPRDFRWGLIVCVGSFVLMLGGVLYALRLAKR